MLCTNTWAYLKCVATRFRLFFSSLVDYAWLDSVHGFMAPNTVRDSKLSNEKENHLWKIEMRERDEEKKEETFSLQVFLSLATCISCNSNLKHTRFPSTYIVSLLFYHFLLQITYTFFAFMVEMMRSKHKHSSRWSKALQTTEREIDESS